MAHQAQPGGGHEGAGAGVVQQHDAGAAHADPAVGGLHELAAGRIDAAGAVVGLELGWVADVEDVERAGGVGLEHGELGGVDGRTPEASANWLARCRARLRDLGVPAVKRSARPRSQRRPASSQPMVPLRSATTLFGMPARRRLSAPMMLRVRPAQFTTTRVFGSGAISPMR